MEIGEILTTSAGVIVAIISLLFTVFKTIKSQKQINASNATQNVYANLPSHITDAETIFKNGTGEAKLAYVLIKATQDALTYGAQISDTDIINKVEEILNTPTKNKQGGL